MKRQLLQLELPKKYKGKVFEYIPSLDGIPDMKDYIDFGYTLEQYKKFSKLVQIEYLKYKLDEELEYDEITDDEKALIHQMIDTTIKEYNEM